jgi:hypothetical protein
MPFSHVRQSYQPEQLANLTEAFNLAWPQIMLANRTASDIELEGLRQRLANFIVACASRGEFDPATGSKKRAPARKRSSKAARLRKSKAA